MGAEGVVMFYFQAGRRGCSQKVAFEQSPEGGNGAPRRYLEESVQATETAGAKALG